MLTLYIDILTETQNFFFSSLLTALLWNDFWKKKVAKEQTQNVISPAFVCSLLYVPAFERTGYFIVFEVKFLRVELWEQSALWLIVGSLLLILYPQCKFNLHFKYVILLIHHRVISVSLMVTLLLFNYVF